MQQCVTTWTAWWSAGWWKAEQQRVADFWGKETRSWRLMGFLSGGNTLMKSMTYWYVETMDFVGFVGMFLVHPHSTFSAWLFSPYPLERVHSTGCKSISQLNLKVLFATHSLKTFFDLPSKLIVSLSWSKGVSIFFCFLFLHQQQMHGTLTFLLIPSSQIKPAPHRQTVVSPSGWWVLHACGCMSACQTTSDS